MLGKTRHVHFVGIGGIGMSGIAELLANLGYVVTGSDERRTAVTERLSTLGIRVAYDHQAGNVGRADVVVCSSAVRPANPEVVDAVRRHIPVIPRGEMLAELMRLRSAIAVAGSHGKTTTTSMIAVVLERAGLDPTAVIGGRLSAFGSNARLGRGQVIVAEADESDRSFLKLLPTIAVITNIDREHIETYGSLEALQDAFVDFANKVPFHGAVVACLDNSPLAEVLPRVTRRVITYGLDAPDADVTAVSVSIAPMGATATILNRSTHDRSPRQGSPDTVLGQIQLRVPGRHNLLNALAAVAVGLELGLSFDRIAAGLAEFRGAERRFEVRGEPKGVLIVDDYGHHPTEIAAVIAAAQTFDRRIIVAFQPHRFSRTSLLMSAFGPALSQADHVVLTDIYGAGEDPLPGATIEALAASIKETSSVSIEVVPRLVDVAPALVRIVQPGDMVITMGAGSIAAVPDQLIHLLERDERDEAGEARARS